MLQSHNQFLLSIGHIKIDICSNFVMSKLAVLDLLDN